MQRKRAPSDGWPPGDGCIVLPPGAWVFFHQDTPFSPNLDELKLGISRLRGDVLADSFGIENEMVLLQLAETFGTNDAPVGGSGYKDAETRLRASVGFGRMVDQVKPIIRSRLPRGEANKVVGALAGAKKVRDLFAHYPCWIEPVNDAAKERTVGLKAFIGDQTMIYEMDEPSSGDGPTR